MRKNFYFVFFVFPVLLSHSVIPLFPISCFDFRLFSCTKFGNVFRSSIKPYSFGFSCIYMYTPIEEKLPVQLLSCHLERYFQEQDVSSFKCCILVPPCEANPSADSCQHCQCMFSFYSLGFSLLNSLTGIQLSHGGHFEPCSALLYYFSSGGIQAVQYSYKRFASCREILKNLARCSQNQGKQSWDLRTANWILCYPCYFSTNEKHKQCFGVPCCSLSNPFLGMTFFLTSRIQMLQERIIATT